MLRRALSAVLLLLLCLPATSLAVLYTCTMDGLTRMSDCDGHGVAGGSAGHAEGHGDCAKAATQPETCCEERVVTASLDSVSSVEVPLPGPRFVRQAPIVAVATERAGYARRIALRWPGPPLYDRLASYLI